MKTFYDLLQLLKKFGIFIYTRDRKMDLQLMEKEVHELHNWGMIDTQTFQQALLILRKELSQVKETKL
ncbi:hypothetical protein AJ85_20840 [Alkalihalobacillus alcalophilus ATCC 27647 = CGMCC 1.3604]|uniref:Cytosolic protein n=1 Tax=Alkalihalobacillus alcalophilus ATCC 27647 = CGMCC 1.3604 TaxID=1218173 RepID=A0A094XDI9_ALKAL|nr:YqgQ family protein [Alkalihalobacillus alcalophilus]KGA96835.1 hypothetical protein BALCAV_0213950 [Alkalihalobacillus alcalophilus ATCC 27647 = CGMCC 1.3604]MED1561224.1 YqgQ family protein [Alkalihalobacillus alcalophilus]THG88847.1 hypothetical protein AJ85_20840 [Alkalihalobacillus alcalophilus ATCC 27647 = CGMCC 1.3604]